MQILLPCVSNHTLEPHAGTTRWNHTLADWMARGLFTELLEAGIRIFGYRTMIHAKTCTIDGQWSTIGAANIDRLSAVGNYELNAEIYSRELAAQVDDLFEGDKANATELTSARWAARPFLPATPTKVYAESSSDARSASVRRLRRGGGGGARGRSGDRRRGILSQQHQEIPP